MNYSNGAGSAGRRPIEEVIDTLSFALLIRNERRK